METFELALENYLKELTIAHNATYDTVKYPHVKPPIFSVMMGKKNAKIVRDDHNQKSVHCFVTIANGDLLKSSSWKVPAKGVRGSIYSEDKPLLCGDFYIRK